MSRWRRFIRRVADAPFDMLVGFVFLLSALSYLFGAPKPHSVQNLLPHWLIVYWSVEMLIGSVLTIIGLVADNWRSFSAGMWLISGASCVYGVAIIMQPRVIGGTGSAILAASVEWAIAGACFLRAIRRWL